MKKEAVYYIRGITMLTVHPQYLVDEKDARKAVIIPINEWDRILEELEELEDIRAYDAAKQEKSEAIPFEQAVREIEAKYKT